jgi:hypothetical protein
LENLKGRYHSKELGVDARIVLEWILEKQVVRVDWILVGQDRDQ